MKSSPPTIWLQIQETPPIKNRRILSVKQNYLVHYIIPIKKYLSLKTAILSGV